MKIFWDTNLFVYLWEKRSFEAEMRSLVAFIERGRHQVMTSTLTLGEILVQPARSGRHDLVAKYREAMQRLTLIDFGREAAGHFARLRSLHPGLRPPDAIQLGCAITGGCDLMLTNDDRLALVAGPDSLKIQGLPAWSRAHGDVA